jgi:hypothetical protein
LREVKEDWEGRSEPPEGQGRAEPKGTELAGSRCVPKGTEVLGD